MPDGEAQRGPRLGGEPPVAVDKVQAALPEQEIEVGASADEERARQVKDQPNPGVNWHGDDLIYPLVTGQFVADQRGAHPEPHGPSGTEVEGKTHPAP